MPRPTPLILLIAIALLACSGTPERAPVHHQAAATPAAPARSKPAAARSKPAAPPTRIDPALEAELARIAETSGGTLGAAVLHIENGESAAIHGEARFPMQSVFKFSVGVQVLKRVGHVAVAAFVKAADKGFPAAEAAIAAIARAAFDRWSR
jgi:beta-lactamase class A